MSTRHFRWQSGGAATATLRGPIRVDDHKLKFNYEGLLGSRLVFDDGETFILATRIIGTDSMTVDGHWSEEIGPGEIECQDTDGDWLLCHVDWRVPEETTPVLVAVGSALGEFQFTSGTGKVGRRERDHGGNHPLHR